MTAFLKVLRSLLGAIAIALLWALFAWISSGRWQAALILAALALIVAPILLPDLIFIFARFRKRLTRLELSEASPLRDLVLQCVLRHPSLRPRFWLLDVSHDNGFQWFERGWGSARRQEIIISRGWLEGLPEASRLKEFRSLWKAIAALPPTDRRVRTFQFRLWVGSFWMLDLLFDFLDIVMRSLGLRGMPHPVFWCQRFAWMMKRICFGLEERAAFKEDYLYDAPRVDVEPFYWNSWIFGVWSLYPTRCLHPAWRVLADSSGLVES